MIGIAIPVKRLPLAKSRLAGVLDPASRQRLVLRLVRHVISTAQQAITRRNLTGCIWLVSADDTVAAMAATYNVQWLCDRHEELNLALNEARTQLERYGTHTMIVLAGDLPFLTATDIITLYDALAEADLVLAPDQERSGTNALAIRLPSPIPFQFGPDSAARHLNAATNLGLRTCLVETPSLAFDLDDSERLRQYYCAVYDDRLRCR